MKQPQILHLYTSFQITPEQASLLLRMTGNQIAADIIYHSNK